MLSFFLSFFLYFYGLVFINLWNQYHKLTDTATYHSLCTAAPSPPLMYKIWVILLRWGSDRIQTTYQCSYKINNIILFLLSKGFQRQPYCYYWNRSLSGYSRIILHTVSICTRILKVLESPRPQVSVFIEKTCFSFGWPNISMKAITQSTTFLKPSPVRFPVLLWTDESGKWGRWWRNSV